MPALRCLIALLFAALTVRAGDYARVLRVIDGDTIVVTTGPRKQPVTDIVRLAGIDAPELRDPGGPEAKAYLAKLVAGKRVLLDGDKRDRYRRRLAWIRTGPRSRTTVQAQLMKHGHAVTWPHAAALK